MQNDLNVLVDWFKLWQINFNIEKCHVLHVGNNNPQINYSMNSTQLKNVVKEKELGVIVSTDLKPELHCAQVVKTAN